MGRQDETGRHEGFVVGYVPRDWTPTAAATAIGSSRPVAVLEHYSTASLRELGVLAADNEHDVHAICVVGYGCSCGWRSPYREIGKTVEWSPSIVLWPEWLEDLLAQKWWLPHVRAETRRTEQLNHGHSASDSVHAALDLPRKVATDLLLFLKSLDRADFKQIARHGPERAESAELGLRELGQELEALLREGE
jgi:hypothetical protein